MLALSRLLTRNHIARTDNDGRLTRESRAKIITLITIDVHGRDVVQVRRKASLRPQADAACMPVTVIAVACVSQTIYNDWRVLPQ